MTSIGPIYRKLAAICLLFLLLYGAALLIATPLITTYTDRYDHIEELELQSKRLVGIERRLSITQPILQAEVRRGDGKGFLLIAENADLASANLQGRLRSLVTTSGATLRSIRSLPSPSVDGEAEAIKARLSIIGDLESIQEAIYRIETAVPHLFIDKGTLKPSRRQGEGEHISLDLDLELSAYRIREVAQ